MTEHTNDGQTIPETGATPVSGDVAQAEAVKTSGIGAVDGTLFITIVVLGTADALPLLTEVWRKKAPEAVIIPIETDTAPFSEVIDGLMENDDIPDWFILVPANCFPTHMVAFADLAIYRVRRMKPDAPMSTCSATR